MSTPDDAAKKARLSVLQRAVPVVTLHIPVVEACGSIVMREVPYGEVYAIDDFVVGQRGRCRVFVRSAPQPWTVAMPAENLRQRLGWELAEEG